MGKNGKHYTKETVLNAITGCGGVMSTVQQRLGCKSWETARNYVMKWQDTRDEWNTENEHTDYIVNTQSAQEIVSGEK